VLGRQARGSSADDAPQTFASVGLGSTTATVVKTDGAVAWIALGEEGPEVRALDTTGSRMLAHSWGIGQSSLALAGSTVYWTQDGTPMSAALH
jgi:hypothetical protein